MRYQSIAESISRYLRVCSAKKKCSLRELKVGTVPYRYMTSVAQLVQRFPLITFPPPSRGIAAVFKLYKIRECSAVLVQ